MSKNDARPSLLAFRDAFSAINDVLLKKLEHLSQNAKVVVESEQKFEDLAKRCRQITSKAKGT